MLLIPPSHIAATLLLAQLVSFMFIHLSEIRISVFISPCKPLPLIVEETVKIAATKPVRRRNLRIYDSVPNVFSTQLFVKVGFIYTQ